MLFDGIAVIWVVVVGVQYALMMLIPGAPDLGGTYPVLLAGVVIAGIMRYRLSRPSQEQAVGEERPEQGEVL